MSLLSVDWGKFYEASKTKVPHDVKFKVRDPHDPLSFQVFPAHKLLLAAVSSAFEAQFYGEHFEDTDEILVEDSQPEAFEKFLRFIYLGKKAEIIPFLQFCDLKTFRLVFDVMMLADKHLVTELKELCEKLLVGSTSITEDNIFDLVGLVENNLQFSHVRKEIKRKASEFLKENIGTFGYLFIQKLNNQPSFDHEIFRDLCTLNESEEDGGTSDSQEHTNILDRTDIKKNCVVS